MLFRCWELGGATSGTPKEDSSESAGLVATVASLPPAPSSSFRWPPPIPLQGFTKPSKLEAKLHLLRPLSPLLFLLFSLFTHFFGCTSPHCLHHHVATTNNHLQLCSTPQASRERKNTDLEMVDSSENYSQFFSHK